MGIVGRSGSGKTTLLRLLLRMENPSWGALKVGNEDVLAAENVAEAMAVMEEGVLLFEASIEYNITLCDPGEAHRAAIPRRVLRMCHTVGR